MTRRLTWTEWESEFSPVYVNGTFFRETYGTDLATVNAADPATVWTVIDGGGLYLDLVDGMHFIDRLGYVITETPAAPGLEYYVTNQTTNQREK